jgi:hypothetical protein
VQHQTPYRLPRMIYTGLGQGPCHLTSAVGTNHATTTNDHGPVTNRVNLRNCLIIYYAVIEMTMKDSEIRNPKFQCFYREMLPNDARSPRKRDYAHVN